MTIDLLKNVPRD